MIPYPKVIKYRHHGKKVSVIKDLKGRHQSHCLCWFCGFFRPNKKKKNCPIAQKLYEFDVEHTVTTPVWECEKYEEQPEY